MRLAFPRGALSLLTLTLTLTASLASCTSSIPLPSDFTPPQVFKNLNLLRTVDVSKPYVRETIAVIVENVSKEPQSEYYISLEKDVVPKISSIEARDKKGDMGTLESTLVDFNDQSPIQYYRLTFPSPLKPSETVTLQVTLTITNLVVPLPASVLQTDPQYLSLTIPKYCPSSYLTDKQKTKIRFPTPDVPTYTTFSPHSNGTPDPTKQSSFLTYGPYGPLPPITTTDNDSTISVRYDYTHPVIHVRRLERDLEVSHWGGNLATSERYYMTNSGAHLKDQFSRVIWNQRSYYNSPTHAIKMLTYPLLPGAQDVYYTDEIGNVTTSRLRSSPREATLELKPRYPVFGGWNYTFVVGWNHDIKPFLKTKLPGSQDYVLKVPFLQGPSDVITYADFQLTIILPEGATNVKYQAPIPVEESRFLHQTYMDTLGRTALRLTARNLVDELRGKDIIVTYTYPALAALRKPLTVTAGILTIFTLSFLLSKIDTSIGK